MDRLFFALLIAAISSLVIWRLFNSFPEISPTYAKKEQSIKLRIKAISISLFFFLVFMIIWAVDPFTSHQKALEEERLSKLEYHIYNNDEELFWAEKTSNNTSANSETFQDTADESNVIKTILVHRDYREKTRQLQTDYELNTVYKQNLQTGSKMGIATQISFWYFKNIRIINPPDPIKYHSAAPVKDSSFSKVIHHRGNQEELAIVYYERDSANKITQIYFLSAEGKKVFEHNLKYDEKTRLQSREIHNLNDKKKLVLEEIIDYDTLGLVSSVKYYKADTISKTKQYSRNEKAHIIKIEHENKANGSIEIWKYSYLKEDKDGNWLRRILYKDEIPFHLERRNVN